MKYGLFIIDSEDWLREADKTIAIWETSEDAEKWRKNQTVFPNKYSVKKVTPKIIKEDQDSLHK
jgi:hypothetical protein